MQIEKSNDGTMSMQLGYYYTGRKGSFVIIGIADKDAFADLREDFTDLLNGFVLLDK